MEESEASTQTGRDSAENRTNEAPEAASSQKGNAEPTGKPSEETEARYNRLKLFEKVMQKSLEKFMDHARYREYRQRLCNIICLTKRLNFYLFSSSVNKVV